MDGTKISWKLCLRIGVSAFLLYLCIHYWEPLVRLIGLILGAAAPLLVGCAAAYVINILMSLYEKLYFPRSKGRAVQKSRRPVCMIAAFFTLIIIVVLMMRIVVPELISCINLLIVEVPRMAQELSGLLLHYGLISSEAADNLASLKWEGLLSALLQNSSGGLGSTFNFAAQIATSVASSAVTLLIGLIFSIYVLAGKDKLRRQCGRLLRTYLPQPVCLRIHYVLGVADDCFHRYIVGQCLEAVILGTLCAIGMVVCRFPYAAMTGVVIGFTALVPVVGAYLGGAVGFLLILTVSPFQAFLFLIYLVVLQQIEGNVIYPKVVGSSIGLPGIWVLAAVIVGGGIGGIAGVLLGVPVASTLYRLLRRDMQKRDGAAVTADTAGENGLKKK